MDRNSVGQLRSSQYHLSQKLFRMSSYTHTHTPFTRIRFLPRSTKVAAVQPKPSRILWQKKLYLKGISHTHSYFQCQNNRKSVVFNKSFKSNFKSVWFMHSFVHDMIKKYIRFLGESHRILNLPLTVIKRSNCDILTLWYSSLKSHACDPLRLKETSA